MSRLSYAVKIFTALILLMSTAQCALKNFQADYPFYVIYYEYDNLHPSVYQKEVEKLQGMVQTSREPVTLAKAHLRLAFLYSDYRNPAPDYDSALKELEAFISLDPSGGKQIHFQNWLRLLKEIAETERGNKDLKEKLEQLKEGKALLESRNDETTEQLRNEIARLEKENNEIKEQMKRETARLEKENNDIKEKLEQLKHLDIEMEEKRKTAK